MLHVASNSSFFFNFHVLSVTKSYQLSMKVIIILILLTYLLSYLLTYLLNYLLTPCSRVLLEKLTGSAASQEIPRIFGTRRFITVFTSARNLSLS